MRIDELVKPATTIDHLLARAAKVVQILEPLAEHPVVYRSFNALEIYSPAGYAVANVLKKVVNDKPGANIKSGSNPKQLQVIQTLGITNPIFCTMTVPYLNSIHGKPNIFIPSANYTIHWSPVVKDLGGNDIVGSNASKYGSVDKGGGSYQSPDSNRQVGPEFAKTYQEGWPPSITANELIFDCESYYLLDIKRFLSDFPGDENKDIGQFGRGREGERGPLQNFNRELLAANFRTYGQIRNYLSTILPKVLALYRKKK